MDMCDDPQGKKGSINRDRASLRRGVWVNHYNYLVPFVRELGTTIDVLTARGFLFHRIEENVYKYEFSRYRCKYNQGVGYSDYDDLKQICAETNIGIFDEKNGLIHIKNSNPQLKRVLFCDDMYPFSVCSYGTYTENTVGVKELEPYIARYIKTLNACYISTDFSCDNFNNHNHNREIIILATGGIGQEFHKSIVDKYLKQLPIKWNEDRTKIYCSREIQNEVYYQIQLAAEILWRNKENIRKEWNQYKSKQPKEAFFRFF